MLKLKELTSHPSPGASLCSGEFCFYLLTAAFAIQVHESAFHPIRHDNDFRHFRFPFWVPNRASSTYFSVVPKPFPHPFSVFWRLAVFLLLLFRFGISTNHSSSSPIPKASSVLLCSISFYFLNDLVLKSFTCSALHSELTIDRIFDYFSSFAQHVYFPTCVLTSAFQLATEPFHCASHLAQLTT